MVRERSERGERDELRAAAAGGGGGARAASASDVLLGASWIERWLPELTPVEIRLYLHLAHAAPTRTYHDPMALRGVLAVAGEKEVEAELEKLERLGLIEVVRRRGKHHYHLLCRGADGVHHGDPVRPSIKEALDFHQNMMEELLQVASADDGEELRARVFGRYPALRDEYEFSVENRGDGMPEWKLWMELSLYLMNRFEESYGELKAEHSEVFKDVSAQLLRLKLEMLDKITQEVLARRDDVFPQRGQGWLGGLAESSFLALPLIRELSRKFRVGAEQIYLNTIEALQAEGLCVVELDARGRATDLLLPSTTGLSEDEERLVFLHVEEMTRDEIEHFEDTLRKIRTAKEKYSEYLRRRGVETVVDLGARDRIADPDALMQTVADRINEALELVGEDGEDERVAVEPTQLEDVIALYDKLRRPAAKK